MVSVCWGVYGLRIAFPVEYKRNGFKQIGTLHELCDLERDL